MPGGLLACLWPHLPAVGVGPPLGLFIYLPTSAKASLRRERGHEGDTEKPCRCGNISSHLELRSSGMNPILLG